MLLQGSIYLNTSLTEAFGIGLLEAACTGLYVVSTQVGGVPEVLPPDMIAFARPEQDGTWIAGGLNRNYSDAEADLIRALKTAVLHVSRGGHDPHTAHARIREFYEWAHVAERTEVVYDAVRSEIPRGTWERLVRYVHSRKITITDCQRPSVGSGGWLDICMYNCRGLAFLLGPGNRLAQE